ncbi:type 1 glutamine amidotransferase domain-containing protein [Desulfoplanes formicivorans]|uniref:Glutamine amidotransferase n=1 Tax=Desulfoplanes formicivorans TaxID=1592317 RepID=A0A194AE79_9BACT|nr:type 1 glutamine amidotransferase domain-containing protein [Desulfoplanes formicivorans]GAU07633.1 glutamine amidotransferase [Desulfoplanes formicivorans]
MELKGKRIIILIENMYNEFEFWYPYYRLQEAGVQVVVVGAGESRYTSKFGIPVTPDEEVNNLKMADFDGVVIPGGYAPDIMRRHPAMVQLVRDAHDAGKIVAAICHAGWMLASANILANRRVTSFFAIKDDLIHAGAHWTDEPVVRDGNLITSRKPDDLPAFMRTILEALAQ